MLLNVHIKEEHLESLVKLLKSEGLERPGEGILFLSPKFPEKHIEVILTYDEYTIIRDYEEDVMSSNDR